MLIRLDDIKEATIPHLNNGTGAVSARMHMDMETGAKIMLSRLPAGASIGMHQHPNNSEMNYVLSGMGTAICDGEREALDVGVCHYCKKGSSHSIENDGAEELVLFTVVSAQ